MFPHFLAFCVRCRVVVAHLQAFMLAGACKRDGCLGSTSFQSDMHKEWTSGTFLVFVTLNHSPLSPHAAWLLFVLQSVLSCLPVRSTSSPLSITDTISSSIFCIIYIHVEPLSTAPNLLCQQSRKPRKRNFGIHQPAFQSLSPPLSGVLCPQSLNVIRSLSGCSFHGLKRGLVGSHRRLLALRGALHPPFIQLSLYLSSLSSPMRPSSHWIPATVAS
ncbi:hypothetical protein BJ165DRAFT_416624 [Panaeolus papilionaceus]|nr:hypothetical protein BJ165DRAFT_416624 [Panaeolus papilionaceus]